MSWPEFIGVAFIGFSLGFTLGLLTLTIHLVRKGWGALTKPLGGGNVL